MMHRQGAPSSAQMIIQTLHVGLRTYELRYNRCGRRNCSVCYNRGLAYSGPPGHGPYWYLITTTAGRTRRIYIGRTLDTNLYVTPQGDIDWAAYKARHRKEPSS